MLLFAPAASSSLYMYGGQGLRPPVGCAPSSFVAAKLCEAVVFLLGFLTVAGFHRESEKKKKTTKKKKENIGLQVEAQQLAATPHDP